MAFGQGGYIAALIHPDDGGVLHRVEQIRSVGVFHGRGKAGGLARGHLQRRGNGQVCRRLQNQNLHLGGIVQGIAPHRDGGLPRRNALHHAGFVHFRHSRVLTGQLDRNALGLGCINHLLNGLGADLPVHLHGGCQRKFLPHKQIDLFRQTNIIRAASAQHQKTCSQQRKKAYFVESGHNFYPPLCFYSFLKRCIALFCIFFLFYHTTGTVLLQACLHKKAILAPWPPHGSGL